MSRRLGWAAAAAIAMALGCSGAPDPVDLGGTWPARADDYGDTTARWTRSDGDRAGVNSGMTLMVAATATLLSPEWRAAYVDRRAAREGLSAAARTELATAEQAAGAAAHEIELLVTTQDRRANDLGKGSRSIWHLSLAGEDGRAVAPIEVVRDRRPRSEIKAYFPHLGDFDQAYVARFPPDADLFGPGSRRVVLRMASGQGRVELIWQGR